MNTNKHTDRNNLLVPRPPIVTIMGHIDHGKSTLLQYIRKSSEPLNEAGGITQRMTAYEIVHTGGTGQSQTITFIDTPGHESFKGIRTRGAQVADVSILVVSAEDGVKAQTIEAHKSIVQSKTPFIVAINKIDKPGADIARTKQSLAEHEIYIEGYGGDIPAVELSAKTGEGVTELLDMILLVSEMQELTGDSHAPGSGIVLESNCDVKKGVSATCVIRNGTIQKGMYVVSGTSSAPVRIMENFRGTHIESATFSSPISIIGWDSLPQVGMMFSAYASKTEAKEAVEQHKIGLSSVLEHDQKHEDETVVPIIIKADTGGSLEAAMFEIQKISLPRIRPQIILSGIGSITESDVRRADGSEKAIVVGFNTTPDTPGKNLAERTGIEIHTFDIIYKMSEWLMEVMTARTPKESVEESLGIAKVLKIFSKTKDKQIIGGKVEKGAIALGSLVKIIRRDAEIGQGRVKELQEQKNRTSEVTEGKEFGTLIEAKMEIAPGDRIEAFVVVEK